MTDPSNDAPMQHPASNSEARKAVKDGRRFVHDADYSDGDRRIRCTVGEYGGLDVDDVAFDLL